MNINSSEYRASLLGIEVKFKDISPISINRKVATSMNVESLPLPALQEILLKMKRGELNKVCNLSKRVKKVCDEKNFRIMYEKLHPTYTQAEIYKNVGNWIKEMFGETNLEDVESLMLKDLLDIVEMIEKKTEENKRKIIFYGEEVFSTPLIEQVNKLKIGFIANSLFSGIIGSVILECLQDPNRLSENIEMYKDMNDGLEEGPFTIENFILYLYGNYEGFSSIFDLNETFKSETYRRISDKSGLRYENKTTTASLIDVDVWDVNRLKTLIV